MKGSALINTLLVQLGGAAFLVASAGILGVWVTGSMALSEVSRLNAESALISRGHKAIDALAHDMKSLLLSTQQVSKDFSMGPQVRDHLAGLQNTLQSCASASCHGEAQRAKVRQIEPIVARTAQTLEPLLASPKTRPETWAAWSAQATGTLEQIDVLISQMLDRLSLRAEQARNVSDRETVRIQRRMLLAAGVALILAALVALLMTRYLLRPLVRLREGMQRSSGKTLVEDVEVQGPKEIGDLAQSFNSMVARVRDYASRFESAAAKLHQLTVQTSIDGYWVIDGSGRLLEVNDAYCRLSGYSRQELLAMNIADLEAQETADEVSAHIRSVSQSGVDRFETRHRRKDGSIVDLDVSVRVLDVANDRLIAFLRDISERRQTEVRLRHLDKMEALSKLTAGVVHEYNNLLTVVEGTARLAMDDIPAENRAQKGLQEIRGAVARASELSRRLLTFSREQESQREVVKLNGIAGGMERLLRATVGGRVELAINPGPDDERVRVDPREMEQILINLAINARDAMPNGGKILIETSSLRLPATLKHRYGEIGPGSYRVLSLTDTGTGMSPEVQEHLFEPFFTTKGQKGTGLGLSIVHGIVSRNSGHITVDSQVGRGTTFRIYLPAVDVPAP
ncbi:MAG: PAS domain S-box protein [Acidobacteria bacterium]|nr:PAS domain S-box protein [Acidobacteriota bacterium]